MYFGIEMEEKEVDITESDDDDRLCESEQWKCYYGFQQLCCILSRIQKNTSDTTVKLLKIIDKEKSLKAATKEQPSDWHLISQQDW